MSDVTQAEKPKREAIAERNWVLADGSDTTDETKATGFSYVWKANGRKYTHQFDPDTAGESATMLAIFGGLTKAGNIANTWKTLPENERGPDPIDDISEWFKRLDEGAWGEERAGGVGTRFDKEKLAVAIAHVTKRHVDEFLAKLNAGEKVTPKGEKREILYGTYALRNDAVRQKYNELVPATNAPTAEAL
jgi:hypothetical protein